MAHDGRMQVYDWGEAKGIAKRLSEALIPILGQGRFISGESNDEGCFIATAVFGDYDYPSVLVLRRLRDKLLSRSRLGRLLISRYYRYSPSLASRLSPHSIAGKLTRQIIKAIIALLLVARV